MPLPARAPQADEPVSGEADQANGGIRREPVLPEHEAIAVEEPVPAPEFSVVDDEPEETAVRSAAMRRRVRSVARQATMDPDDGVAL